MRLKIKFKENVYEIELNEENTVEDLNMAIFSFIDINKFEIRHKFPPRKVDISECDRTLKSLGILDSEVLLVKEIDNNGMEIMDKGQNPGENGVFLRNSSTQTSILESKDDPFAPPEIELENSDGRVVLRVMQNDNSCLFRAVGYIIMGKMDTANELRSLVAQTIQNDPTTYSDAILGRSRDEYCRWINKTNSWGGAIEILILANHFEVEICSIDVATGRTDRFGEGRPMCGFIVYSGDIKYVIKRRLGFINKKIGIHYDAIALTPMSGASPNFDTTIFSVEDLNVRKAVLKLTDYLRKIHYYTDTSNFSLKCKICKINLRGRKDALEHAKITGHSNFDEY